MPPLKRQKVSCKQLRYLTELEMTHVEMRSGTCTAGVVVNN